MCIYKEVINAVEEKLIAKSIKDAKRLAEHFWKQRDEAFADSIKQTS